MNKSFQSCDTPIQSVTLPIRKYWGKTDPRTPPEFLREFECSSLCTGVDRTDNQNFLSSLGDPLSFYAPAFYVNSRFDYTKKYFLRLTWTDLDRQKKFNAIGLEKFDPNGEETWESYLIRTYIRLDDCRQEKYNEYNDEMKKYENRFQEVMMMKIMEVGKSHLPVNKFMEDYCRSNEHVLRVRSFDFRWFAEIVYSHSDSVFGNHEKLTKDVGTAPMTHQSDSKIENLPTRQLEVSTTETRRANSDNLQKHEAEKMPNECNAENSFRTAFLFSVLYSILYYLISQFWNFGGDSDTSIMRRKRY